MDTSHQDLQAGMSRLSISSSTHFDSSDELLRMTRRHSSVSSEDSWQSPTGLRTPASSLFSEDLEISEPKPRQRSTVIHEEVESPTTAFAAASAAAAEEEEGPRNNDASDSPATPAESPVLPPADLIKNNNHNNNHHQPKRVLQAVEYDLPYTHPTMPWDKFYSSRADYPDSMFESFLKYHQGALDVLHDLGAGSGLAADGLLSALRRSQPRGNPTIKLPRTILSDPGEENLGITSRFVHARHSDVAMECWQARGEEQDQFLAPGSVDMTICAEALHWMDMPSAISQVARSLRPGGTFAVVLYSCFPRILNNAHIKRTLRSIVEQHLRTRLLTSPRNDHHYHHHHHHHDDDDSPIDQDDDDNSNSNSNSDPDSPAPDSPSSAQLHPNWARGMRYLAYGLDAVELPADQWESIKRFEINCGTTGWWWPSASKDALGCATPMADASPHERLIYESYDDWGRVASVRELKELLLSIQVGFGEKTWESPLWKELEKAAKGPLHLVWQTHMILARKKGPRLETVPEE